MKKKLLIMLVYACLVLSACGYTEKEAQETDYVENENIYIQNSDQITGISDQISIEQAAELINQDLLSISSFADGFGGEVMLKKSICKYAEFCQEPFTPVIPEESVIPGELVLLLEEALYDFSNENRWAEDSNYHMMLTELGADEYEMSLELLLDKFADTELPTGQMESIYDVYVFLHEQKGAPRNIDNLFYMGESRYLFEYKSGGSNGVRSLCLTEYTNGSFHVLMDFEIGDSGNGKLINYGEDFYFIFLQWTSNSQRDFDGIGIYKIGENAVTENLQIRYLPKEYLWESIEDSSNYPEVERYINGIREDITSKEKCYLDVGYDYGQRQQYRGDEEETADFEIGRSELYKADIANLGIPVYMEIGTWWTAWNGLQINFYLWDPQTENLTDLDQLSIRGDKLDTLQLTNIWFKEIYDKTYTFFIYYVSDYSYVLNVALLEGGEAKPIQSWFLLPQREFVLIEGEVFTTAG